MKIIDFEIKGNQIKFYVGADNCENYWGDDWDDRPYEHNAGKVYNEFIIGWFVKTFDFDDLVMEVSEGPWLGNSPYSKEDMKKREVPCVCVLQKEFQDENVWSYDFYKLLANEKAIKYYFGDYVDETKEEIHYIKDINEERKYLTISFDSDVKTQRIISNVLGETISSYTKDFYSKKQYDEEYYKNSNKITLEEYKEYIINLMTSIYRFYKIENVEKAINTLKIDFKPTLPLRVKPYPTVEKTTTIFICVKSPIVFEVGEVRHYFD